MWLRAKLLGPTEPEDSVCDPQLSHGSALEVVSPFPRLDEGDLSFGVQEGDGKTRKACPGAQIHHGGDVGELSIQRQGVEDQPSHHRLGVTLRGQIHPRGPSSQQFCQLPQGLGERLEFGVRKVELLETSPDELAGR